MTWQEVIDRDDIIGGDLEAHEGLYIYRGPISAMELKLGQVKFRLGWTARMPNPNTGAAEPWEKWPIRTISCDASACPLRDIGDSKILFSIPGIGFAIIFPKGTSKLSRTNIRGL